MSVPRKPMGSRRRQPSAWSGSGLQPRQKRAASPAPAPNWQVDQIEGCSIIGQLCRAPLVYGGTFSGVQALAARPAQPGRCAIEEITEYFILSDAGKDASSCSLAPIESASTFPLEDAGDAMPGEEAKNRGRRRRTRRGRRHQACGKHGVVAANADGELAQFEFATEHETRLWSAAITEADDWLRRGWRFNGMSPSFPEVDEICPYAQQVLCEYGLYQEDDQWLIKPCWKGNSQGDGEYGFLSMANSGHDCTRLAPWSSPTWYSAAELKNMGFYYAGPPGKGP